MRVAFVKHWNEYKRGEEIDVTWDRAMYLFKCGLVRWIGIGLRIDLKIAPSEVGTGHPELGRQKAYDQGEQEEKKDCHERVRFIA